MAKKRLRNVAVTVETDKAKVTVEKKEENLNIEVDTPNVDVTFKKDEDSKEFTIDSKKLDVSVKKEGDVVTAEVTASSNFLTKVGNFISKIFTRKFKKN
jgi:hypothetical protein